MKTAKTNELAFWFVSPRICWVCSTETSFARTLREVSHHRELENGSDMIKWLSVLQAYFCLGQECLKNRRENCMIRGNTVSRVATQLKTFKTTNTFLWHVLIRQLTCAVNQNVHRLWDTLHDTHTQPSNLKHGWQYPTKKDVHGKILRKSCCVVFASPLHYLLYIVSTWPDFLKSGLGKRQEWKSRTEDLHIE